MKLGIRTLAEVVAVISVVISLLFVGYELRLSRSIAVTEGMAEFGNLNRSFREFVAENSDVWGRGCNGGELTLEERIIFNNIAQARINLGYVTWVRSTEGILVSSPERVAMGIALNRHRYPGFNTAYLQNAEVNRNPVGDSGSSAWSNEIDHQYQLLIDSNASKEVYDGWCGR